VGIESLVTLSLKVITREAPHTDLACYPANMKAGYRISGVAAYRISGRIFGSNFFMSNKILKNIMQLDIMKISFLKCLCCLQRNDI
jgi:hypothetical protein